MIWLQYWKPIAIALILIVSNAYSYKSGMDSEKHEWEIAVSESRANNLKINAEVSNDYQKKIADLRKRYDALRVRPEGGVQPTNSASGFNAAAITNGFHVELSAPYALMLEADLNTQQLIALQEWVKSVK